MIIRKDYKIKQWIQCIQTPRKVKDPNKSNTQKYFRHSNVEKIRIGAIEIWVFHLFWPFIFEVCMTLPGVM